MGRIFIWDKSDLIPPWVLHRICALNNWYAFDVRSSSLFSHLSSSFEFSFLTFPTFFWVLNFWAFHFFFFLLSPYSVELFIYSLLYYNSFSLFCWSIFLPSFHWPCKGILYLSLFLPLFFLPFSLFFRGLCFLYFERLNIFSFWIFEHGSPLIICTFFVHSRRLGQERIVLVSTQKGSG